MAVKNPCLLPYLVLDHNKKINGGDGGWRNPRKKRGRNKGERRKKGRKGGEMVWVFAWVLAIPGDLVMNLPLAGDGIDDTWFVLVDGFFVCFDRCFGC
jgi:hypothetical protein